MNARFMLEEKRREVEWQENWREWWENAPKLKFKEEWEVKIIPPTQGAMIRFVVFKGEKRVSVYLDTMDRLGCMGRPYFEIYPYEDDVKRYLLDETEEMMNDIEEELNR